MVRTLPLLIALAALAGPATAQAPPPRTVEPLVVSPQTPLTPKEADALARTFVRALSEPGRIGQLSRWQTRPCAKAIGLPEAFDAFVAARIETLAGQVGAPVATPCKGNNILVVFTTEPQKLLDFIAHRRTQLLGFHYAAQTKRLATFKGPVQAWYVTATVSANGDSYVDDPFEQTPGGSAGSHFTAELSSAFEAVLVVVDSGKIAGHPVGRIADDVAMAALARSPAQAGCRDLPTILDALNAQCQRSADLQAVSESDRAYLKGLYAANPRTFLQTQETSVAGAVSRDLQGRSAAPAPNR
jgi:hypothetical protein